MSQSDPTPEQIGVLVRDGRPSAVRALALAASAVVVAFAVVLALVFGIGHLQGSKSEESLRTDIVEVSVAIESFFAKHREYPDEVQSSDNGLFVTLDNTTLMDGPLHSGNAVEYYVADGDTYALCLSGNAGIAAFRDSAETGGRVQDNIHVGAVDEVCR